MAFSYKKPSIQAFLSCSSGFLQACRTHWLSPVAVQHGQDLHECGHPTHGQRVWLACWCSGGPLTSHGPHTTTIMTRPTLPALTVQAICCYNCNIVTDVPAHGATSIISMYQAFTAATMHSEVLCPASPVRVVQMSSIRASSKII